VECSLDPETPRLGRRERRAACAVNSGVWSETLVALLSMREANHTLKNLASGQETSFVASIADLRVLVIPQMMDCSQLRGAAKTGTLFPLLRHAAQQY